MASKTLRQEVLPIFYGSNTFVFSYAFGDTRIAIAWRTHKIHRYGQPGRLAYLSCMSRIIRDFGIGIRRGEHSWDKVKAVLLAEMTAAKEIKLSYHGALNTICTCHVEDIKAKIMDGPEREGPQRQLIDFCVLLESTGSNKLRWGCDTALKDICEKCGKHKSTYPSFQRW